MITRWMDYCEILNTHIPRPQTIYSTVTFPVVTP